MTTKVLKWKETKDYQDFVSVFGEKNILYNVALHPCYELSLPEGFVSALNPSVENQGGKKTYLRIYELRAHKDMDFYEIKCKDHKYHYQLLFQKSLSPVNYPHDYYLCLSKYKRYPFKFWDFELVEDRFYCIQSKLMAQNF